MSLATAAGGDNTPFEKNNLKELATYLEQVKGVGTSVITLTILPNEQIVNTTWMLTSELKSCSNIKSKANRTSVVSAISSIIEQLKKITHAPKNGLLVFCGTVNTKNDPEKKMNIATHFVLQILSKNYKILSRCYIGYRCK